MESCVLEKSCFLPSHREVRAVNSKTKSEIQMRK